MEKSRQETDTLPQSLIAVVAVSVGVLVANISLLIAALLSVAISRTVAGPRRRFAAPSSVSSLFRYK
jgi:hypothetical protein